MQAEPSLEVRSGPRSAIHPGKTPFLIDYDVQATITRSEMTHSQEMRKKPIGTNKSLEIIRYSV